LPPAARTAWWRCGMWGTAPAPASRRRRRRRVVRRRSCGWRATAAQCLRSRRRLLPVASAAAAAVVTASCFCRPATTERRVCGTFFDRRPRAARAAAAAAAVQAQRCHASMQAFRRSRYAPTLATVRFTAHTAGRTGGRVAGARVHSGNAAQWRAISPACRSVSPCPALAPLCPASALPPPHAQPLCARRATRTTPIRTETLTVIFNPTPTLPLNSLSRSVCDGPRGRRRARVGHPRTPTAARHGVCEYARAPLVHACVRRCVLAYGYGLAPLAMVRARGTARVFMRACVRVLAGAARHGTCSRHGARVHACGPAPLACVDLSRCEHGSRLRCWIGSRSVVGGVPSAPTCLTGWA
jgi:hypothetical protein